MLEIKHKIRISNHDVHYGGNLVDGARILGLFGDVATEILIQHDGDEGLFRAYDNIEFLQPVFAGDFLEIVGKLISTGNTSRKMEFFAYKYITAESKAGDSAALLLETPVLVCKASGTCVTPRDKQRINHG